MKVKVWHRATDPQQWAPLLPGCSRSAMWTSQVASDLTSTLGEPVGREAEVKKKRERQNLKKRKEEANLVGRKGWNGGRGDRGGTV